MYFGHVIGHIWPLQRRHFPEEFRADLYVFGIRRARRMGTDKGLIQNPNFYFVAPPPNVDIIKKMEMNCLFVNILGKIPKI